MWDCTQGIYATAEASNPATVAHELGHAVFAMPDEYCCNGAYWDARPILFQAALGPESASTGAGGGAGPAFTTECGPGLLCTVQSCEDHQDPAHPDRCLVDTIANATGDNPNAFFRGNCCIDTVMTSSGTDLKPLGARGLEFLNERVTNTFPPLAATAIAVITATPTTTTAPVPTMTPAAPPYPPIP
jgi:hypothetical protein